MHDIRFTLDIFILLLCQKQLTYHFVVLKMLERHPAPQSHLCGFVEGEVMVGELTSDPTEVRPKGPEARAVH